MLHTSRLALVIVALMASLCLPAPSRAAEPKTRPAAWAAKLDRPGLPNLHKLNDGLYRGAQPTAQGIHELEKLGIKTIVGLRSEHSDREIVGGAQIAYEAIPMQVWDVHEEHVVRFLRIATDKNRQPVFVHCQHGADRAGVLCAAYRVAVDGWTKQQAVDEMVQGGFGYHRIWSSLITFINGLDVEKIRSRAGLN